MLSLLKRFYFSIAFLPSFLAACFFGFAILLISFPTVGGNFDYWGFLTVAKKDDIQFVLSFVVGGIFTLNVFSYTMVMSVLNRSINNYSPRLVPLLLSQKNHQFILGFNSGTLLYSITLSLFAINGGSNDFPPLASFFAILFAAICVALFIYFIHSVSQSIHINHILARSFKATKKNILFFQSHLDQLSYENNFPKMDVEKLSLSKCGYLQRFELKKLGELAKKHQVQLQVIKKIGTFVYEGETFCLSSKKLDPSLRKKILNCFSIDKIEAMEVPEIGLKHLVEVAIKASSPAINDPGTSLSAIEYLTQLLIYWANLKPFNTYKCHPEDPAIHFSLISFEDFTNYAYREMWRYMKDDPILKKQLGISLTAIQARISSDVQFPVELVKLIQEN